MSHITGTVQSVAPSIGIGPDFGPATSPPNTWALDFAHVAAPMGTKLVMLHFTGASFPASNRLEVDLGYGGEMDVFTSASGTDFWTRPINIYALPGGLVPIRYITDGAATGGVQLIAYGRGERHTKDPENPSALFDSFTNCDPFLGGPSYLEPQYATFWFCNNPPHWENVACIAPPGDIRNTVSPSVGMIMHVDFSDILGFVLSTCSVTLVEPDVIITAGHCMTNPIEDARSASVFFGYQTDCLGNKPGMYSPIVIKVREVIRQRYADGTNNDYCLLRLETPVPGVTPRTMRADVPGIGEEVFCIHHPNGAVKKLSAPHPGFAVVDSSSSAGIRVNVDITGGSSGSGLFDSAGRIVGVLSGGSSCSLLYFPTATILQDIAAPPAITRDVMMVFDRSGSMSLPGTSGAAKIVEARAAASLFVQLVRADTGNRVGLVSFSTAASDPVDFTLAGVTAMNKAALIGPAPFNMGIVGDLHADGSTSMGSGLNAAYAQLPAVTNPRNVLLFTDGLQNTPPMVDPNDPTPGAGIRVDVIGYGTPASLDGTMLTALAASHNGQYVLADTNLELQKFFALAFGNIFEAGLLMDPEFVLPKDRMAADPLPFQVCEEETITVVVGWENRGAQLILEVTTPLGATITGATAGVESASAHTWTFLRVPLPQAGERDGTWNVNVLRPHAAGVEVSAQAPAPEVRYFVNVVAGGGAVLRRIPDGRPYYTGDAINPIVGLQYLHGGVPPNATVKLTVSRPDAAVGTLLSQERLGPARTIDADTIPPRQATLMAIEQRTGRPAVGYTQQTFDLFTDVEHTGAPEAGGLFGNPLNDLLTVEGNYTFHYRATYGDGCTATRELIRSLHVEPGIDAGRTGTTLSGSSGTGSITLVPRDRFGNNLGPGRGNDITITGAPGTTVTGPVVDNGDGTYTVPVAWNPSSGTGPGVAIGQPDRPAVVVHAPVPAAPDDKKMWKVLWILLVIIVVVLLVLWRWKWR